MTSRRTSARRRRVGKSHPPPAAAPPARPPRSKDVDHTPRATHYFQASNFMTEPVFVVDGARTPFLKARNRPGPFAASDLATQAGRALLLRQRFEPHDLDEVILGCASPSPDEVNIGRVVALRMGCGREVPGWTVMRNCASGMQALDSALTNIRTGRSQLVLAGGVDALSRAPLLYSDKMVLWFANLGSARTFCLLVIRRLTLSPLLAYTPLFRTVRPPFSWSVDAAP